MQSENNRFSVTMIQSTGLGKMMWGEAGSMWVRKTTEFCIKEMTAAAVRVCIYIYLPIVIHLESKVLLLVVVGRGSGRPDLVGILGDGSSLIFNTASEMALGINILLEAWTRNDLHHFCPHFSSQNSVIWPGLIAKEASQCSLAVAQDGRKMIACLCHKPDFLF